MWGKNQESKNQVLDNIFHDFLTIGTTISTVLTLCALVSPSFTDFTQWMEFRATRLL